MTTVRNTFRRSRGWLVAVIGILGIIGGARQQLWANCAGALPPVECRDTAGSAGALSASFSNPESATR